MKYIVITLLIFAFGYSNAKEYYIDGEFEGWDDGVVVRLNDGTCWQQAYYYYYYYYYLNPKAKLYKKSGLTYLKVDGCPEMQVYQVNCSSHYNDNASNFNNSQNYINIQNNTNRQLFICYAAYNGSNGWQSNGWFKVDAYSYTSINIGLYVGNVYLYAEDSSGDWIWRDEKQKFNFCIHKTDKFNVPNADISKCLNSNYKLVNMIEYYVPSGGFTWTLNP